MRLHHGACLVAALLLAASSADAQSTRRLTASGRTLGEMVRSLPRSEGGARQKVIGLDSTSSSFIFAAAGSVQGAGGTFFRSDVTLINHRNTAQRIGVGFMKQGVDNSNAPIYTDTLPANAPVVYTDFIGEGLGESGLGAVLIFGADSGGNPDPNALLDGNSRIWTPQPGSAGTVSQGFPSVAFQDSVGSAPAYAAGLRHDPGFRTNAGIVNLDSVAHTWEVDVNGVTGLRRTFSITVPPLSLMQQVVPSGDYGDVILGFQTTATGAPWSAYAASVDNITGDSWSAHASQP